MGAEKINVKSIKHILKEISNLPGTKRLGLLSTTHKDNQFHPSQDLKTEFKSLDNISDDMFSIADIINTNSQPIMTIWN